MFKLSKSVRQYHCISLEFEPRTVTGWAFLLNVNISKLMGKPRGLPITKNVYKMLRKVKVNCFK